ncbi:hypothetical protein MMC25_005450 [Agyrium rufum]|nr:hypothetical protein [Agyrium rufum]
MPNTTRSPSSSRDYGHVNATRRLTSERRKLRIGTFRCWECKHRKARCEFRPNSNSTCVSCQRRGLSCIIQELPEPGDGGNGHRPVQEVVDRVEGLVGDLIRLRNGDRRKSSRGSVQHEFDEQQKNEDKSQSGPGSANADISMDYFMSSLLSPSQDPLSGKRSLSSGLSSILPHPPLSTLILDSGN